MKLHKKIEMCKTILNSKRTVRVHQVLTKKRKKSEKYILDKIQHCQQMIVENSVVVYKIKFAL